MHSLSWLLYAQTPPLVASRLNTRHSRVTPASVIISSTLHPLSPSSCSIIIIIDYTQDTLNSSNPTSRNITYFWSVINITMPASNGNGTSMTSTSSRPGSSKPNTPARGANGGNTGHSSLILRKQLLGESIRTAQNSSWEVESQGRETRFDHDEINWTFTDI